MATLVRLKRREIVLLINIAQDYEYQLNSKKAIAVHCSIVHLFPTLAMS